LAPGTGDTPVPSAVERSGAASDSGTDAGCAEVGGAGRAGAAVAFSALGRCFGVAVAFAAAGRLGAAVDFVAAGRFGAAARFGVAAGFGVAGRLAAAARFGAAIDFGVDAAPGDVVEPRDAARDRDGFDVLGRDALGFDDLGFDAAAALARTLVWAAVLREAAPLRAPDCSADCAALAFFFACLAAFLLAFANFRTRLRTLLAARTCCFAASARATAVVASAFSRCAAIAPFVCVFVD
jgi:hypothetical protein